MDSKIKASKVIEDRLKNFVPRFGDESSIRIRELYEEIIYLRNQLRSKKGKLQSKRAGTKVNPALKEKIISKESDILWWLDKYEGKFALEVIKN